MKRFKKIYIEITNKCNLNCSFCSKDNVLLREMTLEEFEHILKQIDDQTDYVYLHVKGEPLLHSHFKEILELCSKYHKKVNLTTNGTLLSKRVDDIITTNIVRQINISLQSIIDDSYLLTILTSVSKILDDTNIFVVYRFWTLNNNKFNVLQNNIYNKLLTYHQLTNVLNENNVLLKEHLYLNKDKEFIWPSLNNPFITKEGTCYGLRRHLAILVDGTVVPCCLDSKGIIKLGNIYKEDFKDIINSNKVNNIFEGFKNNQLCEELCQKCQYRTRFKK